MHRSARFPSSLCCGLCMLSALACAAPAWASAERCAALAASPFEDSTAAGVEVADIDVDTAITACREAISKNATDSASLYRLARALVAGDRSSEAIPYVRRAAEAGYAPAFSLLGYLHFTGSGLPEDPAAGFESYRRAHELGYPFAAQALAWFYYHGKVVTQDLAHAAELYREAADAGVSSAQGMLGKMLWDGTGIAQDRAAAIAYYRTAAEAGDAWSQAELATHLMNGNSIPRDRAEAYRLAVAASEQGNGFAAYLRGFALENGYGVPGSAEAAAHWYATAAEAGSPAGAEAYARVLEDGQGIEANPSLARQHAQTAAEAGQPQATARFGRMLRTGLGGPRDLGTARRWLEQAPEQPIAQHQLGLMKWFGEAGPQDRTAGFTLIQQAADSGLAQAQLDIAKILTSPDNDPAFQDTAAGIAYLEKAARQDHPRALLLYGVRLIKGDGVDKSVKDGLAWLDRAAAAGNTSAAVYARLEREQIRLDASLCESMIRLCNRGCITQEDGSQIYNTYDGSAWFHEDGRLIPTDEAPDLRCPQ